MVSCCQCKREWLFDHTEDEPFFKPVLSDPSECGVWIGTQVGYKGFGPYFLLPLKLLELLRKPGEDFWKSFINPSPVYYCYSISKQNVLIGPSCSPTKRTKPKVSWHYDSL